MQHDGYAGYAPKHLVQFAAGIATGEFAERALFRHFLCRLHEAAPGRARERAADADAPHPEFAGLLQRQARRADQEIDGLGMRLLHDRGDFLAALDSRRVDAVGARVRERLQAIQHDGEIGDADQKSLASRREQHAAVVGIDRLARGLDALDGEINLEQRPLLVAGGILDREPGHA